MIIRTAKPADIAAMQDLILEHGQNEWNYIPENKVLAHLNKITTSDVEAVLAEKDDKIIGFATFHSSSHFSRYNSTGQSAPHGYIHEVVVHRDHAGRGLGSMLLKEAISHLQKQGFTEIYIDRHEENRASAGMMRKAGFEEVDTFTDLEHRTAGSRRTTVCRIR